LLTGGTGSFGRKFVKLTLEKYNPIKIIIYSRDEIKQWEMAHDYSDDERIRFFVGDVRDSVRLHRAFHEVDYVVHAAALKIVPSAEYNPFECIKTNIEGAVNVINCAIDQKVKRVVALSTDKACNPVNLYGATKLCSDKLFIAGNAYSGKQDTRFAVVRYGNVLASRGSVIPFFIKTAQKGEIPITDERMTRFIITLEDAVNMVWFALEDCKGGEIYIRKSPSIKIMDLAKAVSPAAKLKVIGMRPGEKLHELLVSMYDAEYTYEYDKYFKILPQIYGWSDDVERIGEGVACVKNFIYSSDRNNQWMSRDELSSWIKEEYKM
ncbi:MAG: UDP-N-acetylglucosamine 4,6-dehydratase (inverting), partial [bacterium]